MKDVGSTLNKINPLGTVVWFLPFCYLYFHCITFPSFILKVSFNVVYRNLCNIQSVSKISDSELSCWCVHIERCIMHFT